MAHHWRNHISSFHNCTAAVARTKPTRPVSSKDSSHTGFYFTVIILRIDYPIWALYGRRCGALSNNKVNRRIESTQVPSSVVMVVVELFILFISSSVGGKPLYLCFVLDCVQKRTPSNESPLSRSLLGARARARNNAQITTRELLGVRQRKLSLRPAAYSGKRERGQRKRDVKHKQRK